MNPTTEYENTESVIMPVADPSEVLQAAAAGNLHQLKCQCGRCRRCVPLDPVTVEWNALKLELIPMLRQPPPKLCHIGSSEMAGFLCGCSSL
jgi:hypothetical protein